MRWFRNFMTGRYGTDQLGLACTIAYLILIIINRIVFRITGNIIVYYILEGVGFVLLAWEVFRVFSRNINKRSRENQFFLKYWYKLRSGFKSWGQWRHNHKVYKYFKCPSCKVKIRVPKGKGKIEITCPKCGRSFIKKS